MSTYEEKHRRVAEARGKAWMHQCADCDMMADEWSTRHGTDGESPGDYDPRCRSCHAKYDPPHFPRDWWWKQLRPDVQ